MKETYRKATKVGLVAAAFAWAIGCAGFGWVILWDMGTRYLWDSSLAAGSFTMTAYGFMYIMGVFAFLLLTSGTIAVAFSMKSLWRLSRA